MKFTEEQLSVISAPEDKVIVSASAGTGKTSTLVEAAARAINEEGSKVVILTLTNAAANEFKDRLKVLPHFAGTIHSFALSELNKIKEQNLFYPLIMSESQMRKLLLRSYIHFHEVDRDYKETIVDIYNFMVDRGFQVEYSNQSKYNRVIRKYNELKREDGLYDFLDGPRYLLEVIGKIKYKLDYTHLFVDEVQDIDYYEFELIKLFDSKTLLIGDPRQTIFQFRNSFDRVFDKFRKLGYNLYILTKNFRSYQEILDYSKSYLTAVRGFGGTVTGSSLLYANKDSVILCRYNSQVQALERYFENVHTVHSYKGLEADDVIVMSFSTQNEENRNMMLVGLTRSRKRLGIVSFDECIEIGRKIKYGY